MKKRKKRNNKKAFNLLQEYKKSWDYIKESRNFIYVVIGLFFIFSVIGGFFPVPDTVLAYLQDFIKQLVEKTQDLNQIELIGFIFWNNLKTSFFGITFGLFFGIFPILETMLNGYVVGFVALPAIKLEGISVFLLRLLPHGIFELPAIFISFGLGIKLGSFIFKENKTESLKDYIWNSLRVFVLIIVPLLIIAAVIEGSLIFLFD